MCDNLNIPIENWGRMSYVSAWNRQKEYVELVRSMKENQTLSEERIIIVEHAPVYTIGFHGNAGNMLASEDYLKSVGAELIRIERGGDITYHGPGQLVVYPIIDIARRGIGVKSYVHILEHSVIELLKQYGIHASCNDSAIGVWLDWGEASERKICAIGVKVRHGVTMHGLALNVNTDLNAFNLINPCGFVDKGVTSIARELGKPVDFDNASASLGKIISRRLKEATR